MSKEVKRWKKQILRGADVSVLIDRPYTIAYVTYHYGFGEERRHYKAYGISKVCWPDRWRPIRGEEVAVGRAVHKIAVALAYGGVVQEEFTPRQGLLESEDIPF